MIWKKVFIQKLDWGTVNSLIHNVLKCSDTYKKSCVSNYFGTLCINACLRNILENSLWTQAQKLNDHKTFMWHQGEAYPDGVSRFAGVLALPVKDQILEEISEEATASFL